MARGWRKSAGFAAVLSALLLTLVLRGLVAPGYMPELDAGGFRIVLCEQQIPPAATPHAPEHDDERGEDSMASEALCAFAAVGSEVEPEALPAPQSRAFAVATAEPVQRTGLLRLDGPSEGPPPPARAPPAAV